MDTPGPSPLFYTPVSTTTNPRLTASQSPPLPMTDHLHPSQKYAHLFHHLGRTIHLRPWFWPDQFCPRCLDLRPDRAGHPLCADRLIFHLARFDFDAHRRLLCRPLQPPLDHDHGRYRGRLGYRHYFSVALFWRPADLAYLPVSLLRFLIFRLPGTGLYRFCHHDGAQGTACSIQQHCPNGAGHQRHPDPINGRRSLRVGWV